MNQPELWNRFREHSCVIENLGLRLDVSRMRFDDSFLERMTTPMSEALAAMEALEAGGIANPDEGRMVGHYWLRAAELAPDPNIRSQIEGAIASLKAFAGNVHRGAVTPQGSEGFYVVLVIGVGGSALGPQFVSEALGTSDDPMLVRFIDNIDPDGIDRVIEELDETLSQTLTVVISKSGGTTETHNGMLEVADAYRRAGLAFPKHAIAVTCEGSVLHKRAIEQNWLGVFPTWDWVGGRTSEFSPVGLVPAALQGLDIDAMLAGARECDQATRNRNWRSNPAALLALMWYYAGQGKGLRDMVVMPYCDRLGLLGRYLQQLVMESLGKETNRQGETVHQGLTVYGNKGSTDQHAFVQQLREGPGRFFATFVNVLRDRSGESMCVTEDVSAGDCLHGFWLGTRAALYEKGRDSITITLDELNARSLGALIALFERAVGLYAELIDVNAYHQPGVEAGKRAADAVLDLQRRILTHLRGCSGRKLSAEEIADALDASEEVETVLHILEHASANVDHGVARATGKDSFSSLYGMS